MIKANEFYEFFIKNDIDRFYGVPDSQLKEFCEFLMHKDGISNNHVITANEGSAVSMAAGYHLATGKIGLVYMQNSGLGNAVNPITSLTDPQVYGIPVVYLIGWRGQPSVKDEPQHIKQGQITLELLSILGIEYAVLSKDSTIDDINAIYSNKLNKCLDEGKSVALVVEKGTFYKNDFVVDNQSLLKLTRESAIHIIADSMSNDDICVSTTGKISRELFEYRKIKKYELATDFLTVGSMGHAGMIALGMAESGCNKRIWFLDGDGAFLMHMGNSALIGQRKPNNFVHVLLNNGCHESVGGWPTIINDLDIEKIAYGFGYANVYNACSCEDLQDAIKLILQKNSLCLINVCVNKESRSDLIRPDITPIDNKKRFMSNLSGTIR